MKIGDRVKVTQLHENDLTITNIQLGDTGTIMSICGNATGGIHPLDLVRIKFDEDFEHKEYGEFNLRWLYRKHLEVIEEAP